MNTLKNNTVVLFMVLACGLYSCKKSGDSPAPVPPVINQLFQLSSYSINGNSNYNQNGVALNPAIRLSFSAKVNTATAGTAIVLHTAAGATQTLTTQFLNSDSVIVLTSSGPLQPLTKYSLTISNALKSSSNVQLIPEVTTTFVTVMDSTDKFPQLTDNALLDKIQQTTFKYFWDFGHPVSGMARERNSSADIVTTGGTGFGIMSIVTAVNRGFITRAEGRDRVLKITDFLTNNCTKYHGAFAHWVNGVTGATIPFSVNDNGGDLVETSLLLEGLLTARQFFSTADVTETSLRNKINNIWSSVEWNWYRQNNQNVLYWHWSPDKAWVINQQIGGWNEALIVYTLAASAPLPANRIPKIVYDNGWAWNGNMKNNGVFFGYTLPLGPDLGGPLFFEHYSFMGINPNGLSDVYANYQVQTTNHTRINYEYCKANPKQWYGYSNQCWGITASDIPGGYNANAPGNNDIGVISPTAAVSSLPYSPVESMAALKFFYYKLGDKLWGEYGFYDAFKLNDPWFANSTLAIDQGPMIVMIENYRSGIIWNLFSNAPEIKTGLTSLGFTAPYL